MTNSEQANTGAAPHARPEDPDTNTRPPGNGDRDERDSQRSVEKIHEVSGH